jgi:Lar family restriction alleviation protein
VIELLACPFCSGRDISLVDLAGYEASCNTCGASGPFVKDGVAPHPTKEAIAELWNHRASNRTPAITQPESNEHKPSSLPLGDAGKLVEALEASVKLMVEAYNAWSEEDEEMLAVINQAKLALSTHLAGTSKGDVTP